MIMRSRALVWAVWSLVAASGFACSASNPVRPGTSAGAAGSQAGSAGASGSMGGAGTSGSGGSSSPQGAAGTDPGSGAAGTGQAGGGAGAGQAGAGGGAAGAGQAGGSAGAAGHDGGTTLPPVDAAVTEGGANGMTAPGLGQDTPSPAKPTIGMMGTKTQRDITFSPSSLDPMATKGHAGENQHGRFDSSKPTKWKLIVLLPGIGGGPGGLGTSGWIASRGYHEMDVAYDSGIPGAPDKPDPRNGDPATVGNTRMNQFDGKGRTPACGDDNCSAGAVVARPDSIEERVMRGLKHLAEIDPSGGWSYYLNPDGTVRWSDCGFYGYSYGATHAAVISVFVRLGLVVVGSGPWNESHPEATWIKTASATPATGPTPSTARWTGAIPTTRPRPRRSAGQDPTPSRSRPPRRAC